MAVHCCSRTSSTGASGGAPSSARRRGRSSALIFYLCLVEQRSLDGRPLGGPDGDRQDAEREQGRDLEATEQDAASLPRLREEPDDHEPEDQRPATAAPAAVPDVDVDGVHVNLLLRVAVRPRVAQI